jgi:hypothetical protein
MAVEGMHDFIEIRVLTDTYIHYVVGSTEHSSSPFFLASFSSVRGEIRPIGPSLMVKVGEDVEKTPSVRSTAKFKCASSFILNAEFPSGPRTIVFQQQGSGF